MNIDHLSSDKERLELTIPEALELIRELSQCVKIAMTNNFGATILPVTMVATTGLVVDGSLNIVVNKQGE